MIETKKTKQFYSINNAVATNTTNIKRMEYNFNNSTLTNIQTSSGQNVSLHQSVSLWTGTIKTSAKV